MTEPQERIWNERLGWIAADGTIEREAGIKKEPPMTTAGRCLLGVPVMRILVALCIAVLVILTGLAAKAQTPQCTGLPDALTALQQRYGEVPRVSGLASNGSLMVITASEAGGFSVLLVTPDGAACMVAAGEGFEVKEPEPQGVDG